MPLEPEHFALLVAELRDDPEGVGYAGKTLDQGFALLHEPRLSVTETKVGVKLRGGAVLKALGLTAGRTFLNAVTEAMPGISLPYFGEPTQLSLDDFAAFRAALNGYPGIEPAHLDAVEAAAEAVISRMQQITAPRVGRAFVGAPFMPNAIAAEDFASAWEVSRA